MRRQRSKLGMGEIFTGAGIPYPPSVSAADPTAVRRMAKKYGYPLVFKPDVGSGAVGAHTVQREGDLSAALESEPQSAVVQPFISDRIVTFDGLADREGRPVFWTSHAYDTGIMQVRSGKLDGSYYSLRELPSGLEELGRRAVAAFDVRERFFHVEFFQLPDQSYVALEMNLRPPGGFTTDMMNAACDIDVYELWASVMLGRDLSGFRFERRYHTAHAGRRAERRYRLDTTELRRELGATLVCERPIPPPFTDTMGDTMFMLRHAELPALERAIALVQSRV
jgi:biotin carboxylase